MSDLFPPGCKELQNKKRYLQKRKNGDIKGTGKQNEELKIGLFSTFGEQLKYSFF